MFDWPNQAMSWGGCFIFYKTKPSSTVHIFKIFIPTFHLTRNLTHQLLASVVNFVSLVLLANCNNTSNNTKIVIIFQLSQLSVSQLRRLLKQSWTITSLTAEKSVLPWGMIRPWWRSMCFHLDLLHCLYNVIGINFFNWHVMGNDWKGFTNRL